MTVREQAQYRLHDHQQRQSEGSRWRSSCGSRSTTASFGSFFDAFVEPSSRTRAASVAGTSTTGSPAATSCSASNRHPEHPSGTDMAKTVTRVSMDCGASMDRKDPSASRNRDELALPFEARVPWPRPVVSSRRARTRARTPVSQSEGPLPEERPFCCLQGEGDLLLAAAGEAMAVAPQPLVVDDTRPHKLTDAAVGNESLGHLSPALGHARLGHRVRSGAVVEARERTDRTGLEAALRRGCDRGRVASTVDLSGDGRTGSAPKPSARPLRCPQSACACHSLCPRPARCVTIRRP